MAQNQSPRRLSMAATTSRPRGVACASNTDVVARPASGTPSPTARPRAAARPTRTPVKLPGPMVTAISDSSRRPTPASPSTVAMAGSSRAAWSRPLFGETGQAGAVAHDGDAKAAHRAIEGQDQAHGRPACRALAPTRWAGHCWIMKLDLVAIAPPDFDVDVTLAYATDANLTGRPVYRNAECWLHREAAEKLGQAVALARPLGLRLRIFDALRPVEAQWALWNARPDPEFLADPRRGSPHSRGVAVDLTLLDGDGRELDMGTAFDAFTPLSHHGRTDVSAEAQRNRLLLMGLMTAAGWDFYRNEWWHYQLFDARRYPLISDADLAGR